MTTTILEAPEYTEPITLTDQEVTNTNLTSTTKPVVTVAQPAPVETTRLKLKWLKLARNKIAPAYKISNPEKMALLRNKYINRAYAEVYFSEPQTFKWAGLAVFASHSIGEKLELLRRCSQVSNSTVLLSFGTALPVWYLSSQLDYLFEAVARGNKAIFADIYWQHLAYMQGGIEELARVHAQGELKEQVFRAWQLLDEGKKTQNADLIWKANIDILEYEQKVVIQPILYQGEKNQTLWSLISKTDSALRFLVTSPVPEETRLFGDSIPNGNLAKITHRWKWCTDFIMPGWQEYETKNPQKVKHLIKSVTA